MKAFVICIVGIYASFLSWGVLQERISTTPYGTENERFKSVVFMNTIQSAFSAIVAFIYLKVTGQSLGLSSKSMLVKYAQLSVINSLASPFGYASLAHIDYPTMILGKACKLVPVMLMNIVLYRRRFPLYKYITVMLVTAGVAMFMLYHPVDPHKVSKRKAASSSLWGLFLLLVNLLLDGATNSTQDQMFHKYPRMTGQQMMFAMSVASTILTSGYLVSGFTSELSIALDFVSRHPGVLADILLFSAAGSIGQCFIFYTLSNYGSLSLVTVTVTRKLFTMLLSVVWFNHHLAIGQWMGVIFVFGGIGLEAYIKIQSVNKIKLAAANGNGSSKNIVDVKKEN